MAEARDRRARLRAQQRARAADGLGQAAPKVGQRTLVKVEETAPAEAAEEPAQTADAAGLFNLAGFGIFGAQDEAAAADAHEAGTADGAAPNELAEKSGTETERQGPPAPVLHTAKEQTPEPERSSEKVRHQSASQIKVGVRVQDASGKIVHVEPSEYQRKLWAEERHALAAQMQTKLVTLSAADTLEHLALLRSLRLGRQQTLQAQWQTEVEVQHARRAQQLLSRRVYAAVERNEHYISNAAREAGELLFEFQELVKDADSSVSAEGLASSQQQVEKLFLQSAQQVSEFKKQMSKLQKLLRSNSVAPSPRHSATPLQRRAGLSAEEELASHRRQALGQIVKEQQRGQERGERALASDDAVLWEAPAADFTPEDADIDAAHVEEVEKRVAEAMRLLDQYEVKPVKIRLKGLRQTTIHDEDRFKRMVVDKVAESLKLDKDVVRISGLKGGTEALYTPPPQRPQ